MVLKNPKKKEAMRGNEGEKEGRWERTKDRTVGGIEEGIVRE